MTEREVMNRAWDRAGEAGQIGFGTDKRTVFDIGWKAHVAGSEARQAELERERAALVEALRRAKVHLDAAGRRFTYLPYARDAYEAAERARVALAGVVEAEPDGSER